MGTFRWRKDLRRFAVSPFFLGGTSWVATFNGPDIGPRRGEYHVRVARSEIERSNILTLQEFSQVVECPP